HEYGSVEGVLEHVENLKGKMKEKVSAHQEDAIKSKALATIYREVPMNDKWEDMKFAGPEESTLAAMFRKLEFKSLLEKLELSSGAVSDEPLVELKWEIADEESIAALAGSLDRVEASHLEVIGDNPHTADVLGLALCTADKTYYVPY